MSVLISGHGLSPKSLEKLATMQLDMPYTFSMNFWYIEHHGADDFDAKKN